MWCLCMTLFIVDVMLLLVGGGFLSFCGDAESVIVSGNHLFKIVGLKWEAHVMGCVACLWTGSGK